tara:strand:- start:1326 stop:2174 length:849 start_codon:yes stop_codon:yes gene_type:complete
MRISVGLIVGQAVGLKCLKIFFNKDNVKIDFVISSDQKYNFALKNLCLANNIKFYYTLKEYLKKNNKKNKRYVFLLSIFSKIILKKNFLKRFKKSYNLHPAILPDYPGINPISGMIFNREKKIGITLHEISEKIDAGKIIMKKKTPISLKDNLITCTKKIENLSKVLIKEFLNKLIKNKKIKKFPNKTKNRKSFPKTIPDHGQINFDWKYEDFLKFFNAGFSGPFSSDWGRIYFKYKRKKKVILNYKIIKKKKDENIFFVKNNVFELKLKNKTLKVLTSDNR